MQPLAIDLYHPFLPLVTKSRWADNITDMERVAGKAREATNITVHNCRCSQAGTTSSNVTRTWWPRATEMPSRNSVCPRSTPFLRRRSLTSAWRALLVKNSTRHVAVRLYRTTVDRLIWILRLPGCTQVLAWSGKMALLIAEDLRQSWNQEVQTSWVVSNRSPGRKAWLCSTQWMNWVMASTAREDPHWMTSWRVWICLLLLGSSLAAWRSNMDALDHLSCLAKRGLDRQQQALVWNQLRWMTYPVTYQLMSGVKSKSLARNSTKNNRRKPSKIMPIGLPMWGMCSTSRLSSDRSSGRSNSRRSVTLIRRSSMLLRENLKLSNSRSVSYRRRWSSRNAWETRCSTMSKSSSRMTFSIVKTRRELASSNLTWNWRRRKTKRHKRKFSNVKLPWRW